MSNKVAEALNEMYPKNESEINEILGILELRSETKFNLRTGLRKEAIV